MPGVEYNLNAMLFVISALHPATLGAAGTLEQRLYEGNHSKRRTG